MSKKANPVVIGFFVIFGLIIAFLAILLLGSGHLFKETERFVLYFNGNLTGLDIGAPVVYRGVRLGSVCDIRITFNTDTGQCRTPVYVELDQNRIEFTGSGSYTGGLAYQIKKGLRAQLQSQSFITGKLLVMLIEFPNSKPMFINKNPLIQEIPTVSSLTDSLREHVEKMPLEQIAANVNTTIHIMAELAQSGLIEKTVGTADRTLHDINVLVTNLNHTVPRMVTELNAAIADVRLIVKDMHGALDEVRPVTCNLVNAADRFLDVAIRNGHALLETQAEVQQVLDKIKLELRNKGGILYRLRVMMDKLSETADTLKTFLDYLQQHPESFITGKAQP